ncbi:MAG: KTSC domain-containing protein [Pseudomonadota bacterium]
MEVEFNSGGVYHSVPEAVYAVLMSASAKGHCLNNCIKDRYHCQYVQ